MPLLGMTSCFLYRLPLTICTLRLCFVQASSAFEVCGWPVSNVASAWDCLDSARPRTWPSQCCVHGNVMCTFPRAENPTATWRHRWVRPGWEAKPKKPPAELDRAVTFAPSGDVVIAALGSLRKGGVVAINAIHLDRIPQFDYDSLLWGERQLRSVANMTRADARDFLALAVEIGLKPKVTVFKLDQANEALIAVKNDAVDGAAVILP